MQVTAEEIRLDPLEAAVLMETIRPLRSNTFIDAICQKIEEQLPAVQSGELSNFYVTIEVYDY